MKEFLNLKVLSLACVLVLKMCVAVPVLTSYGRDTERFTRGVSAADSGVVRIRQLYCRGNGFHLRIDANGTVAGTREDNHPDSIMELFPVVDASLSPFHRPYSGEVRIMGLNTRFHLCINNNTGQLYSSEVSGPECVFQETLEENGYNTYSTNTLPDSDSTVQRLYLALGRRGRPRRFNITVDTVTTAEPDTDSGPSLTQKHNHTRSTMLLRRLLGRRWKLALAGGVIVIVIILIGADVFGERDAKTALHRREESAKDSKHIRGMKELDDVPPADRRREDLFYVPPEPRLGQLFHMTDKNDTKFTFRQNPNWRNSTCPRSLQRKAFLSEEFGPIFRPDTQMVINSKLFNVDEYWRMKPWATPFGYNYKDNITYEEVRDVLNMFPADDTIFNFKGRSRPQCITCAVIGNGGMLNGSKNGEEIDRHNYIFRVNHALTKGFEEDVGSRTTHYVFYDRSLVGVKADDYPISKDITYIFVPCRKADFSYLKSIAERKNKFAVPPENVRIIHPDWMRYIHYVWMRVKSFRPTTGGIMVMAALNSCDKLSLYGLGYNTKYSHYYYDKKYKAFKPVLGSHDHRKEIKLWDSLDREGITYWYRRDVF
ncbi:PREDICTED: alpha-N-acetylgalactosaminide alpha-2,6-sialyltransferase 1-like [Branchiostoma belcheri]|uniref:alpha-N-acetylgalactosaminide alpha-2,6-sialyltransferase n=1 Tax=Branchiostoma belcheri TaxID=7741 RepID=A0A6P4ZH30_BRABE|nr:PREDICTED: alpha-N-acetylgalactosaminide alpha-2,6-sialyltransferase 1-like [Branchiostoma belcheri]